MCNMTGITLIDKYATFYTGNLRRQGFTNVRMEDVLSELGEAYAMAEARYSQYHNAGAKFDTYTIAAFKRRMIDYTAQCRVEQCRVISRSIDDLADTSLSILDELAGIEWSLKMKREILSRLRGREILVFSEMISPSLKVREAMKAIDAMYSGASRDKFDRLSKCRLSMAIALVTGYSFESVRWCVKNIRKTAKKCLTLNPIISK